MNFKTLLSIATLTFPLLSHAEISNSSTANPLKQLNVRVSMQRMLQSTDDQYFLSLFAGVHNRRGTLMVLQNNQQIQLKGTQKGNDLVLNADLSNQANIGVVSQLSRQLDANSGIF